MLSILGFLRNKTKNDDEHIKVSKRDFAKLIEANYELELLKTKSATITDVSQYMNECKFCKAHEDDDFLDDLKDDGKYTLITKSCKHCKTVLVRIKISLKA